MKQKANNQLKSKFVGVIETDNGFGITEIPEKLLNESPSKKHKINIEGKDRQIYIIAINGTHKKAGTLNDIPVKYRSIIASAIKKGISKVTIPEIQAKNSKIPAKLKELKTIENLHNFHFEKISFFAEKWKKKKLLARQIFYDSPHPETWFVLDKNTLDLYIYFEPFGTKTNPRLIKFCKMPQDYITAIHCLAGYETTMVSMVSSVSYENLKQINTTKKLIKMIGIFATP